MQASSPMHSCACTEASWPPHELQQDNDLIWKAVTSCRPLARLKMAACLADSNMPLAWQHSSDVWSAPDCKNSPQAMICIGVDGPAPHLLKQLQVAHICGQLCHDFLNPALAIQECHVRFE